MVRNSILESIGGCSLLSLHSVLPQNGAQVFLKLESENPTGSMKDRMALAMIEAAEADGRLPLGGSVVEYTGGSTGVSLSLVCAVKRHPLHIVTSDAFAEEKLNHMRLLGAKLEVIPSQGGGMTEALTREMIRVAGEIAKETGAYWTDQLKNTDQLPAYYRMADEIWEQTSGRIDAFVQSIGTAACLRGVSERLRQHNRNIRIVGVEPAESPVLSGGPAGSHMIDGVGAGFVIPLWKREIADHIERVSTEQATEMAIRLARDEGVFGGTSTGANMVAALRVGERLNRRATVVTLMCDTGMKYLTKYHARS